MVRDSGRDPTARRGRVPDHVGDRLLGDPVGRHLHGGRQGGLLLGQVEIEAQAGGHGKLATELSHCTEQTQLVDRRRTEPLDDAAHLGDRLADAATKTDQPVTCRPPVGEQGLHGVDLETEACERGAQAVVQVVAEAAAFLFPGDDELFLGVAQVLDQGGRVHDAADLVRQVGHQVLLGGAQRSARPAEDAHLLAVRKQRELLGRLLCGAAAGQQPPGLVADLGTAQAQTAHQLVGERVQQGRAVGRVAQPSAGLAEHLGRRRPATVGESVHPALEGVAQRSECHGHDARGRQRQPGRPAVAQHDPDPGHDHCVEDGQGGREQDVRQRLVERERDVVEPALQHGHRDGDRDRQRDQGEHPRLDPRCRHERQQGQRERKGDPEDQHLLASQLVAGPPPVHQRADRKHDPETSEGEGPDRQEVDEHCPAVRHADGVLGPGQPLLEGDGSKERAGGEGDHAPGGQPRREPGLCPAVRKDHRENQHEQQPADASSRSADHRQEHVRRRTGCAREPVDTPGEQPLADTPCHRTGQHDRGHPVLGTGHLQDHSDHGAGEDHGRDGEVVEAAAASVREQHRGERAGGSSATGEQRHPQIESAHPCPLGSSVPDADARGN